MYVEELLITNKSYGGCLTWEYVEGDSMPLDAITWGWRGLIAPQCYLLTSEAVEMECLIDDWSEDLEELVWEYIDL